jgi:hypothetical protein
LKSKVRTTSKGLTAAIRQWAAQDKEAATDALKAILSRLESQLAALSPKRGRTTRITQEDARARLN